jgi:4-hydroxy-3-methylbut-2-en-1-yl diphosphate reductase
VSDTRSVVLAPLPIERWVLRRSSGRVIRTGMGRRSAELEAARLREEGVPGLAIAGFCGAVDPSLRPGDLVVASRVFADGIDRTVPSASLLAADLRRRGLHAVTGPVGSVERIARGEGRAALAERGAIAVDMESAWLAEAAGGRPVAVVRAVVDTPDHELRASVRTLRSGVAAASSLRAAVASIDRWGRALASRRVLLAGPRSFCAGVERAIDIVERALDRFGAPVYVRKQIVHNVHVVRQLERRGAVFVDEVDDVPPGAHVVFSAHGISPAVREAADLRDLRVIDATCPLVAKVHAEAKRFARSGRTIFLIGHAGHEEIEGTTGEAPGSILLIDDGADPGRLADMEVADPTKVAYLTQTTLAVDEVDETVELLRERFPMLEGPGSDDICYATQNRQDAVKAIAQECDLLLVIGSDNSSNSKRLVEVARREGCRAELIDDESDVDLRWLDGVGTIGLTAGASAPESMVERVVGALEGLGPVEVDERRVIDESLRFTLPSELRDDTEEVEAS